jgi:predicted metal-dependent hydrolase
MPRSIELNKKRVEYSIRESARAKRMRLTVYCNGSFVVTVPKETSASLIEKLLHEKSQWIIEKLAFFKSIGIPKLTISSEKQYVEFKEQAEKLAERRVRYFNSEYGFSFKKINIKNQKTRWGSCSKKGNLNFNYKIALLPQRLADYIIVHELCHLGAFNHSQKFWNLVAKTIPDHEGVRKELLKAGLRNF